MAVTPTQLDSIFKQQLGRPATDYEAQTLAGADLQRLANIGKEYSSLNKDQSIVDYLKYTGQDPSDKNRIALGQKYGISNLGSAEGNTALLNALKSGKAPSSTTITTPVPGTVSGATMPATAPTTSTVATPQTPSTPTDPVQQALSDYQSVQKKIADIDSQVSQAMARKKAEVSASGGVVDESQLASLVAQETAPLLAQRKDLVSQQSIAGKNYQTLLAQQKTEAAQWKTVNMPVYDEYGNVVGHKLVDVNASQGITRPLNGSSSGTTQTEPIVSGTQGQGISSSSSHASTSPSLSTPKSVPLATGSVVNVNTPGYTTSDVVYEGKNTQVPQSYIDLQAINAIMGGKSNVSSGGRGVKSPAFYANEAINARIGQLDPGGNLSLNKAEAEAWGKTLSTQINYATTLNRSLQSADADFQQILGKYKNSGINDHNVPIANLISNASKYNLGNSDVAAFKASLSELGNLYQQVFSRSGQVTDSVRNQANDIINGNLSLTALQNVADQLQALGKIDVDKANQSIQATENQFKNIAPTVDTGTTAPPPMDNTQFTDTSGGSYEDYLKAIGQ